MISLMVGERRALGGRGLWIGKTMASNVACRIVAVAHDVDVTLQGSPIRA